MSGFKRDGIWLWYNQRYLGNIITWIFIVFILLTPMIVKWVIPIVYLGWCLLDTERSKLTRGLKYVAIFFIWLMVAMSVQGPHTHVAVDNKTPEVAPVKAPAPVEPIRGSPEWWTKYYPKLTAANPVTGEIGVLDEMSVDMLIYKMPDETAYWGVNLLGGKEMKNGVEVYGYDPQLGSEDMRYFPVR